MTTPGLERPILVGGTGRSGSTIVGHLLDHHPDLTLTRPMEVRFIAGAHGLADALATALASPHSEMSADAAALAVDRLRNRWFQRAEHVGLHESMTRADVDAWSDEYLATFGDEPVEATRLLTRRIMARIADRLGASRLVDTTPANARKADRLEPIYPESSVVIVTRDGRDVSASFVSQSFGPDDVFVALDQWERRMLRSHLAARASRPERVLSIELVDLVVRDRAGALARLCDFVEVPVDPTMVEWFDANVTADGMHPGRWRRDFDADTCARIDEQYEAMCARLTAEGVPIPS
ncbi:MAG: sulfotransferase [Actinobacteria bacterium]|jgi:hypothetical protein|nr:sulfotransferase [Actinomycetota bacterium]